MATWRELGEVPDSEEDDDSFDEIDYDLPLDLSIAAPVQQLEVLLTRKLETETPAEFSVKDDPQTPTSSPLTEIEDLPDGFDDGPPGLSESPPTTPRALGAESRNPGTTSLHQMQDDSEPDSDFAATVRGNDDAREEQAQGMGVSEASEAQEWEDRQTAVRYSRSLRPRKPIQEHPYLLENAQYSHLVKSHGIKPVRMAQQPEAPRKAQEEDSQEQDYEEESQNTAVLDEADSTQQSATGGGQDAAGETALSSSPPGTTPRNLGALRSSLMSGDEEGTDRTSVLGDDDDLPSLKDLTSHPRRPSGNNLKRRGAPRVTLGSKRQKTKSVETPAATTPAAQASTDIWAMSSSPVRASAPRRRRPSILPSRTPVAAAPARHRVVSPVVIDSDPATPKRSDRDAVLNESEGHDEQEGQGTDYSDTESGSERSEPEFDVVQAASRRIKGVLPASWLRLDQEALQKKTQAATKKRALERSPDRLQRRGVAQPRVGAPTSSSRPLQGFEALLSSSDDDEENQPPRSATAIKSWSEGPREMVQSLLVLHDIDDDDDDSGSAMEDNYIDPMISRKRPLPSSSARPKTKKTKAVSSSRRTQSLFQPKITSFNISKSSSKPRTKTHSTARKTKSTSRRATKGSQGPGHSHDSSHRVPRLSILDLIESDAPQFIKIAARTARRRKDKGRSSPSSKVLHLADRQDALDVMTILETWRRGAIAPRASVVEESAPRPRKQQQLAETAWNTVKTAQLKIQRNPPTSKLWAPSRSAAQPAAQGQIPDKRKERRPRTSFTVGGISGSAAGPALLETDLSQRSDRFAFREHKRILDRLYRKAGGRTALASYVGTLGDVLGDVDHDPLRPGTPSPTTSRGQSPEFIQRPLGDASYPAQPQPAPTRRKARRRKQTLPVHVDIEAPRYVAASEPIIFSPLLAADAVDVDDVHNLLKQAFNTYRTEAHLPPGFNEYCRALVGRCHFLVQQWDHRKSNGVVGAIFDFFASQNLSHLRGEEADGSPNFLENLPDDPPLRIEPQDRCFHIFLKLLASLIKRLVQAGAVGPLRNIIARTMPNHNRLYRRDQAIERRDLASLRNHHDLLCTLFWAAPAKMRPSVRMIENLVSPADSHKEACLINLRAWSQLARFMVSVGGSHAALQPFGAWQTSVFRQVLNQYDSVAAEVQQQLLALAKDVSHAVDDGLIRAMVASNKRALLDVMHSSVVVSLDAIGHARSLETAQLAANMWQLQSVFQRFVRSPPEFEWRVLQPALATMDRFLDLVHERAPEHLGAIHQAEDAISDLDHGIASPFFLMARNLAGTDDDGGEHLSTNEAIARDICTQQVVSLAARLTLRFAQAGVLRLSQVFARGRYSVFSTKPSELGLVERRYLSLFVTILLERGQANVGDLGISLIEVWLLSIVKPRSCLSCEHQLAENLRRQMCLFVPETSSRRYGTPDYKSNRDLFEYAVSYMRRTLRDTDQARGKRLSAEYAGTLRAVMRVVKEDLKALVSKPREHAPFVAFVREVIGLMRTHASDICGIDEFFLQMNPEYSPSADDPRLHVAGMVSYGLRFEEGDSRAANELFYYLYNSFKKALSQGKLDEEVRTLRRGMRATGILAFVLGHMLPAVLQVTLENHVAHPLLDVYGEGLGRLLTGGVVAPEIPMGNLGLVTDTYRVVLALLRDDNNNHNNNNLSRDRAHVLRRIVSILNSFWPTLQVVPCRAVSPELTSDLWGVVESFSGFASEAAPYLALHLPDRCHEISVPEMLRGLDPFALSQDPAPDRQVAAFASNIADDVRRNWICTATTIAIRAPVRVPGGGGGSSSNSMHVAGTMTQQGSSSNGTKRTVETLAETVGGLHERLEAWNRWWGRLKKRSSMGGAREWRDDGIVVF